MYLRVYIYIYNPVFHENLRSPMPGHEKIQTLDVSSPLALKGEGGDWVSLKPVNYQQK